MVENGLRNPRNSFTLVDEFNVDLTTNVLYLLATPSQIQSEIQERERYRARPLTDSNGEEPLLHDKQPRG